jgi:hypothetical protein
MRALIVRPFGQKEGIDFDQVEKLLIGPALRAVEVNGATTEELVRQGNIREDMFALLLKYDLVVADISIHNANVFYELGVRHALRDRHTFMIRCKKDEVPFDLRTDRCLEYDAADPQAALARLIEGLRQTVVSGRADSPVFRLVSGLQAQDWTRFLQVPRDFTEEVVEAAKFKRNGDLDLLASEVEGLEWEFEGLKQIGRELYSLRFDPSAKAVWERVVAIKDDDAEAWGRLAGIYQRLGDSADSERALDRVLDLPTLAPENRAKLCSLRGSHEKRRWVEDWEGIDQLNERRKAALVSPHLISACKAYEEGFKSDLNHAYSGLNALALLVVRGELAGTAELAGDWANLFETDQEASDALRELRNRRKDLEVVVRCALEAAKARVAHGEPDIWTAVSLAELRCIAGQAPARVARAYGEALAGQRNFDFESVRQKLRIFDRLGLLGPSPAAAIAQLDEIEHKQAGSTVRSGRPPYARVLLFTGHVIDEPGRATPRFPAGAEKTVREWMRRAVGQEVKAANGPVLGIAGGACGGDILFHEVCAEFKPAMFARLYLSVPPETYVPELVARGGGNWVERFYRLCPPDPAQNPRLLAESKELPRWLRDRPGYGPWKRNNSWMLCNALVRGAEKVKLIALWDGEPEDGQDGTANMIQLARTRGIEVVHLDTRRLRAA